MIHTDGAPTIAHRPRLAYVTYGDPPRVGDLVICRGEYAMVRQIIRLAPGDHDYSPIRNDLAAVGYVTDRGVRWIGAHSATCPECGARHILCADPGGCDCCCAILGEPEGLDPL